MVTAEFRAEWVTNPLLTEQRTDTFNHKIWLNFVGRVLTRLKASQEAVKLTFAQRSVYTYIYRLSAVVPDTGSVNVISVPIWTDCLTDRIGLEPILSIKWSVNINAM